MGGGGVEPLADKVLGRIGRLQSGEELRISFAELMERWSEGTDALELMGASAPEAQP